MMPKATVSDRPASPARARESLRDLHALRQLLADGWQIEAPVLIRLSWAQRHTGEQAYHIILTRATQRSLIVIADSPAIARFLRQQAVPFQGTTDDQR